MRCVDKKRSEVRGVCVCFQQKKREERGGRRILHWFMEDYGEIVKRLRFLLRLKLNTCIGAWGCGEGTKRMVGCVGRLSLASFVL